MASLAVAAETILDVRANWKLLVEGGLEAYHFKVAHRNTIGPHFQITSRPTRHWDLISGQSCCVDRLESWQIRMLRRSD